MNSLFSEDFLKQTSLLRTRNILMMMFFMWQTTVSWKTEKEMQKFVLMTI